MVRYLLRSDPMPQEGVQQLVLSRDSSLGARASRPQREDDNLVKNRSYDFWARDARGPRIARLFNRWRSSQGLGS